MNEVWPHFTREHPCPSCGHWDWNCRIGDKKYICMRVESNFPAADGGWYHDIGDLPKPYIPPHKRAPIRMMDFTTFLNCCRIQSHLKVECNLPDLLGVEIKSIESIGFEWSIKFQSYVIPMRDGDNKIIGIQLRGETKKCITGSRLGLFIPQADIKNPCYICEGASDCAALLTMGFFAIGRPSCNTGADMLKVALKRLKIHRVVIVADADEIKPTGKRPGYEGALKLKTDLGLLSVIYCPPNPLKDVRQLLQKVGAESARRMIENSVAGKVWTRVWTPLKNWRLTGRLLSDGCPRKGYWKILKARPDSSH